MIIPPQEGQTRCKYANVNTAGHHQLQGDRRKSVSNGHTIDKTRHINKHYSTKLNKGTYKSDHALNISIMPPDGIDVNDSYTLGSFFSMEPAHPTSNEDQETYRPHGHSMGIGENGYFITNNGPSDLTGSFEPYKVFAYSAFYIR